MASYWIVVTRGNAELFDLLSVAFRGRSDFSVIMDRRGGGGRAAASDTRGRGPTPGPDEFIVAERQGAGSVGPDSVVAGNRRVKLTVPVRRRRVPPASRKPRTSVYGSGGGAARSRTPRTAERRATS
jgi:hypothetical protein